MRVLASILFIYLWVSPASAAAIPNSATHVGNWLIQAYTDDNTGAFADCEASVDYPAGHLEILINRGASSYMMGLTNNTWNLPPNSTYPTMTATDNGPRTNDMAIALSQHTMVFKFTNPEAVYRAMKVGHVFHVWAAGGHFDFALNDSARALDTASQCVNYHTSADGMASLGQNPFTTSAAAPVASTDDAALRTEALAVLSNLLSGAALLTSKLIPLPIQALPNCITRFGMLQA
jgi:hypothetical protein